MILKQPHRACVSFDLHKTTLEGRALTVPWQFDAIFKTDHY